jgi:hypothetical protein
MERSKGKIIKAENSGTIGDESWKELGLMFAILLEHQLAR